MRSRAASLLCAVLLALLVAAAVGAARAEALAFLPATHYSTAQWPQAIAVADVNNDGIKDLVTANLGEVGGSNTVSVLLGDGHGGFGAHADFATGADPESVAVGDFNGDGKQDIVTANFLDDTVSLLLGDGHGGFGAHADFATGTHPESVAVGDLNNDGKLDLVTANSGSPTVSVLLGNGHGGFGAATDFATFESPVSVAVGDFNGDGGKDLVTADYSFNGAVSVLLGNGLGSFGAKTDVATETYPLSVAVGDLDHDGKQDLVTAGNQADTVSVLLGNGSGGFGAHADFATGAAPCAVAVADCNGDGKLDVVTASTDTDTVRVLLQAPVTPTLGTPSCPKSVKHGRQFKVYGTLIPHFDAYAKTVRVKAYRYVSGEWKLAKSYATINTDSGIYTKYTATVTLAKTGKYHFKASTVATTQFNAAVTGFSRTLTVK